MSRIRDRSCGIARMLLHHLLLMSSALVQISTGSSLGGKLGDNGGSFCEKVLDVGNFQTTPPWTLKDCDLHSYDEQDVAACFEVAEPPSKVFQMGKTNKSRPYVHGIVFMGDSRSRQQFVTFNFKFLPKYDLVWTPEAKNQRFKFGNDASVESKLLQLRVSYQFRIVFDSAVKNDLRRWTTYPYTETPTLVIIGIAIHGIYKGGLEVYKKSLTCAEPLIRRLASITDVIWWVQDPILDSFNEWHTPFANMFNSPLVAQYNQAARQILKDSGVRFWDSSAPYARDYCRSCNVLKRKDRYHYRNCFDGNHMGALNNEKIINLLLNFYCNGFLGQKRSSRPLLNFKESTCCFTN